MDPNSEKTRVKKILLATSKALEEASLKGRSLGEEVTRLQDVVARKKEGWKEARDARGRAEDALKQAKTTWARADNEVESTSGQC